MFPGAKVVDFVWGRRLISVSESDTSLSSPGLNLFQYGADNGTNSDWTKELATDSYGHHYYTNCPDHDCGFGYTTIQFQIVKPLALSAVYADQGSFMYNKTQYVSVGFPHLVDKLPGLLGFRPQLLWLSGSVSWDNIRKGIGVGFTWPTLTGPISGISFSIEMRTFAYIIKLP